MSYLPNNIEDCIAFAEFALRKAKLVLGDLVQSNPLRAGDYENINLLVFDHARTTIYTSIALDYVIEAYTIVEQAEKLKGGKING